MQNKIISPKTPTIVRNNPIAAATISKLNKSKKEPDTNPVNANIPDVSMSIRDRIKNNENIVQLFPDIELSIQILTSSILSPNDMLTTNLLYTPPEIKLPVDVKANIMDTIKRHIKVNYNLEDKLQNILRETLFTKGSYIEAVIPEASIDELINPIGTGEVTVEEIDKQLKSIEKNKFNFLGSDTETAAEKRNKYKYSVSTESLHDLYSVEEKVRRQSTASKGIEITLEDLGLSVTDNPSVLSTSLLKAAYRDAKISESYFNHDNDTISSEDAEVTDSMLDDFFKDSSRLKEQEYTLVKSRHATVRESVGKPLIMKLPSESVIPVHVVNNPKKHLGYFVLLDDNGLPVDAESEINKKDSVIQNLMNSNDTKLNIISKAKHALSGITKKDIKLNNLESLYSDIAEKMLKQKLSSGLYADIADIKDNADIYRVMLFRALRARRTRILFLPAEVVAYYAFDYRDNGTGRSLIEKVSMLFSIRSILLFSKLMANIKNSVTTTEVSATLEDNDPDPEKTMEKIISESLKTRQTSLPLGVTKIDDLTEWVHKVGFKYNFKHPGLPDMDITTSDNQTSKVVPEMDLDEDIEEMIIMSFGLTPEIVKAGYNEDFATTVMSRNLLLAKRVTHMQNTLNPLTTKHVLCYLKSDIILRDKIKGIIESNISPIKRAIKKQKKDEQNINYDKISDKRLVSYILRMFETETTVKLPKPELSEAQSMKESFEAYKYALEDYLELIISEDALPEEIIGKISGNLDVVKSVMKTILIKKWMADNGYMPEISEFLSIDDDGKPVFDILGEYSEYAETLTKSLLPFLKKNKKFKAKIDAKLDKIENEEEPDETEEDDFGTPNETGTGDGDKNDDLIEPDDDLENDEEETAETENDGNQVEKDENEDENDNNPEDDTGDVTDDDDIEDFKFD